MAAERINASALRATPESRSPLTVSRMALVISMPGNRGMMAPTMMAETPASGRSRAEILARAADRAPLRKRWKQLGRRAGPKALDNRLARPPHTAATNASYQPPWNRTANPLAPRTDAPIPAHRGCGGTAHRASSLAKASPSSKRPSTKPLEMSLTCSMVERFVLRACTRTTRLKVSPSASTRV